MRIKTLRFFLLLTIFITPLIPASPGFGYELIKVVFFLSLTIIAGAVYLFNCFYNNSFNGRSINCDVRWTKIKLASLIFLMILTLTSVMGIHPFDSLIGKYPYYQGLILYWFLFLFFLMVSESKLSLKSVNKFVSFSAVIVAIIAIIQFVLLIFLKIEIPTYAGRVVSTFGQPNLYSGFLLLVLPFAWRLKKYRYLIIFVISLGILVSLSKASIAILSGAGLWFLISKLKQKGLAIYLLVFCFINILVFSLENSSGIVWDEVITPLTLGKADTGTVEKRAHILPVMFEIYSESPVMGFGIDSINSLYTQKFAGFSPETIVYSPVDFNLKNLYVDRSHNYLLDLLIFSGILGFLSYLYLIYFLFKSPSPKYLRVFLVLYLIWTQFQVQSIVHLMLFWAVAGVIDNRKYLSDDEF